MSETPHHESENTEAELPEDPRKDPTATVDALEEKVSRDIPDQPDQEEDRSELPGSDGTEPPA